MATRVVQYPHLTDTNFKNRKFRVVFLLDEKDVRWIVVCDKTLEDLTEKDLDDAKKVDKKARNIIINCVSDRHIDYVRNARMSVDMLIALRTLYKFDNLVSDLEGMGSKLNQDDKVCHLLLTLPNHYDNVVTVLETMDADLTLDLVKSRLRDTDLKLNHIQTNVGNEETSFVASYRPVRKCFGCGDPSHLIADYPKAQCKHSDREGSRDRGCRNYRGRSQRSHCGGGFKSNYCLEESEVTFVATMGNETVLISEEESVQGIQFVLDSGCTDHLVMPELKSSMTDIEDLEEPIRIKELTAEQKRTPRLYEGTGLLMIKLEAL
ncbi:hypothetical protein PR048_011229 [Dryococelus australis]|uniref:Uncharacterized protein n=1 Tax=Dryococelus australis TaxID=614101 RepID=A0ABQ9HL10_9NEOP|nr:hypothetical protein PR048_011229 [Dryococelus australis]